MISSGRHADVHSEVEWAQASARLMQQILSVHGAGINDDQDCVVMGLSTGAERHPPNTSILSPRAALSAHQR
jgi:hypothetical protein